MILVVWTATGKEKAKAGAGEMVLTFPDLKDCCRGAVELLTKIDH
jgi:hypothetical protein